MKDNWCRVFQNASLYTTSALLVFAGCRGKPSPAVNTMETVELLGIKSSLLSFRDENGETPVNGSLTCCKDYLKHTATGRNIKDGIESLNLDLSDLDENELVWLFLIFRPFEPAAHKGRFFEPNVSFLTDSDSDGFFEYRLASSGPVMLRADIFDVALDSMEKKGRDP